jgi:hypothetical protein
LEDDDKLLSFGIIPKPRNNPALLRLWEEALSPDQQIRALRFEDLAFDANYRIAKASGTFTHDVGLPGAGSSRFGSSWNWSGAYVVGNRYRRFTVVGAGWTVPKPEPPLPMVNDTYQVAVWVGLDGNFLRSRSLPQAGTTQSVTVEGGITNPPLYTVWFQWWLRDQLYPPVTFDPGRYPVNDADKIICILGAERTIDRVLVLMANLTQLWTVPLLYEGSNPAGLSVEGSTAEWIVERPTYLDSPSRLYPLPNYGEVSFLGCAADEAHDPPFGDLTDLTDARRVQMRMAVAGPPYRSAIISRAKKLGPNDLHTVYRDP